MDFAYMPLPTGNHIRILEVQSQTSSRHLTCTFQTLCLDDCDTTYTAISYAWDREPSATAFSQLTFADGQRFPLGTTLSALFEQIADVEGVSQWWIDAICISQGDVLEKGRQVGLMGRVYAGAERVVVWLGEGNERTRDAFCFMEEKKDCVVESMFGILERPYFQRVWVIQELALNENVELWCGAQRTEWSWFEECVFEVWRAFEGWDALEEDSDGRRVLSCVTEMMGIRDEFQCEGEVRYEKLLQAALHCRATDCRDMVFGFRGIGEKGRGVPWPDYGVSVEEVYIKTASALLCHGKSLDVLALSGVGFRSQKSNLPSWVPDLRLRSYDEPFESCDRASWDAGGRLEVSATTAVSNQLCIQVSILDAVEVCCFPFNSLSVLEQKKALNEVMALQQRSKLPEKLWLGMVAESLIFGLDINSEPARPEYRQYFDDWLAWLQASSSQADLATISGNEYHRAVGMRIDGWKVIMTRNGYFCIGPAGVRTEDLICIAPGCRFPIILRKSQVGSNEFIMVSWCFVNGIMHHKKRKLRKRLDSEEEKKVNEVCLVTLI